MRYLFTTLSLTLLTLFLTGSFLHAQTFNWVKGGGSTSFLASAFSDEAVYFMSADPNGNIYTLSVVGNGAPIIADTFYRPTGGYSSDQNVLFSSYNCTGQMRFAKLISGAQIIPQGVVADNSGHVYLAMDLRHTSALGYLLRLGYDTTISGFLLSREALLQYDTSGHMNWIRFVGNNTASSYSGVGGSSNYLDLDGSYKPHLICGLYSGVVLQPGDTSHYGYTDLKYDVSGTLTTIRHLPIDSTLGISGVTIDKQSDKLYVIGHRQPAFPDSSRYAYLAAFDNSRNLIWKDTLSNPFYGNNCGFISITSDALGHLYLTASAPIGFIYKGDTSKNTIGTGTAAVTAIMKLDTAGNIGWIRTYSTTVSTGLGCISMMPNNKIAAGGSIAGTIVAGIDTITIYPTEGQNALFTIVDSGGYVHTLQQLHGSGFLDRANSVVSDAVGNLYIGGQVEANVWAGSLSPYTTVGGNTDYFIMKYGVDCGCTSMPVANYTQTGTITRSFTYTGTTVGMDSVRWEFGDGGTSTSLTPTHTYASPGTFTACVTVYTSCGSDMHCSDFTIICVGAPTASYTTTTGAGLTKTFTYTGTGLGPSGTLSWTFGDGTPPGSVTPVAHTFSAAGTYAICLTATNPCGTATSCSVLTVTCVTPPVSAFTYSGSGATRSFTYTGTTAGLDSVTWTFGDGGVATGLTPSHTYTSIGPKTVCATVHTNCGIHTQCSTVNILCIAAPVAAFTFSGTGASKSFAYTGTATGIDSVHWDFGDGGTASCTTAGHTYAATGTYHVCVTAYSSCGSHTICHDVTITCIAAITAAFTDTGNAIHGFAYTGTTTGLDSVVWDYGDTHHDTGIVTLHTYATPGSYHLCVIVYTDCGNDTVCQDIIVTPPAGISTPSLTDIKVFPNPATNTLSVTGVSEIVDYSIITVTGIRLQTGVLQKGNNRVALPDMPEGIYMLEIVGSTGEKYTIRFIKG